MHARARLNARTHTRTHANAHADTRARTRTHACPRPSPGGPARLGRATCRVSGAGVWAPTRPGRFHADESFSAQPPPSASLPCPSDGSDCSARIRPSKNRSHARANTHTMPQRARTHGPAGPMRVGPTRPPPPGAMPMSPTQFPHPPHPAPHSPLPACLRVRLLHRRQIPLLISNAGGYRHGIPLLISTIGGNPS